MKSFPTKIKLQKKYFLPGVIIAFAFLLRVYKLSERGFLDYDEAWYANEARSIVYGLKYIVTNFTNVLDGSLDPAAFRDYVMLYGQSMPGSSGKIFYNLTSAFPVLIFGNADFVLPFMSIIFNIGTCILVYFITAKLFEQRLIPPLSVLIFSVSSISIWYARSAFAQASSVFFIMMALFISLDMNLNKKIKMALVALSVIFGILCHPNVLPSAGLVFAIYLVRERYGGLKELILISISFLLIIVSVFFIFNFISELPRYLIPGTSDAITRPISNTDVVLNRFQKIRQFSSEDFVLYISQSIHQTVNSEGIISIFYPVGFILLLLKAIREQKYEYILLSAIPIIVILTWALSGVGFRNRLHYQIYPIFAITIAYGISLLFSFKKTYLTRAPYIKHIGVFIISIYILTTGVVRAANIAAISNKSSFMQLKEQLDSYVSIHGGIISYNQGHLYPQIAYYFSRDKLSDFDNLKKHYVWDIRKLSSKAFPSNFGDFIIINNTTDKGEFADPVNISIEKLNTISQKNKPALSIPFLFPEPDTGAALSFHPINGTLDVYDLRMVRF